MRPAKSEIFLIFFGSLLLGLATLALSPLLAKNVLFLAALPLAALLFLVMVLNIRHMFVFIIMTRSLMDPILEKTKVAGGGGIGGVLNVFVIVMMALLIAKRPRVLSGNRYVTPWVVFLCLASVTVVYSPLRAQAFKLLLGLTTYACMFIAPFFIVHDEKEKKFWIKLLLYSSFIPVGFANLGVVVKLPMLYSWGRLQGTFTHANILAFYLVLVIVITFYVLRTRIIRVSPVQRIFLWLYVVDLMAVLVVTGTRSAWMACAAFFLIYSLLKEKKILVVCFIAGILLMSLPPVQTRLQDLSEGTGVRRSEKLNSWAWRMRLWESAMPLIRKKLVTGNGLGSFEFLSPTFFALEKKKGAPAHNVYVELLFETGIFGLLAYLAIYFKILKNAFGRIYRTRGDPSKEAAIIFSYVIGYMLVCVSDNALYYLAFNWYFWFFTGLMMCGFALQPQPEILKKPDL
jgi:O-antigen ligase